MKIQLTVNTKTMLPISLPPKHTLAQSGVHHTYLPRREQILLSLKAEDLQHSHLISNIPNSSYLEAVNL